MTEDIILDDDLYQRFENFRYRISSRIPYEEQPRVTGVNPISPSMALEILLDFESTGLCMDGFARCFRAVYERERDRKGRLDFRNMTYQKYKKIEKLTPVQLEGQR